MASSANLRIPTRDEIPRVAFVAAAAFYYSPANAFERPKRDIYPQDTVASYHNEVSDYLWNEECALLVLEDNYDEQEDTKIYTALQETYGGIEWPKSGANKIIVGFLCLMFKPGSPRIGGYQPGGVRTPDDDVVDHKRDVNMEGVKILSELIEPAHARHLDSMFTVDMIAVHPNYWRRGNGTALLAWSTRLADEDKIPAGIASVQMGLKNAQTAGFKEREVVKVPGYSEHPEPFDIWIGVREPR